MNSRRASKLLKRFIVATPSEGLAEIVGSLVEDGPSVVVVAVELELVAVASTLWMPGTVQVVATELTPFLYAISVAQIFSLRMSAAT